MNKLDFVVDALLDKDIDKETAIALIEMEFECVKVCGIPQQVAFAQHFIPTGVYLSAEYRDDVYHVDMRTLDVPQIVKLCHGEALINV